MVCLDTSFIIDLFRKNPAAEEKLRVFLERDERLSTTPITVAELYKGAYASKKKREEVRKITEILQHLEILDLSIPVCERYGVTINDLRAKGLPVGDLDVLIASAASINKEILLTRNREHFRRIPGLVVESW